MRLVAPRSAAILVLAGLLQACGGGSGDSGNGGGGPNPDPDASVSVSTTEVSVSARPGDERPRETISITVRNPPPDGLYGGVAHTSNGLIGYDLSMSSPTQGALLLLFAAPADIPNGTYDDQVEMRICADDQCADELDGSPVRIRTRYVISGSRSVSIDRTSIEYRTDTQDGEFRVETLQLTIPEQPFGGASVEIDHTRNALISVLENSSTGTQTTKSIDVDFNSGRGLRPGVYEDTITIRVCYDNTCTRELDGSPFTIATRVTVDTGAEPGVEPLEVLSREALPHNIVDAEYSTALDAVVMVSDDPVDALYVYDVNAAVERQLLLAQAPTAVSVAPDGMSAAVGHHSRITVVDLAQVGQPGAPAPVLLDVTADVLDVILDGHGKVHAFERFQSPQDIHTVDVSTNTEQLSTGSQLYGGSRARLHPAGDLIYTADPRGFSSDALQKWDIAASPVTWLGATPFSENHSVCAELWFSSDGGRIVTACGNTFLSSSNPAQDMTYSGGLELWEPRDYDWLIRSFSHAAAADEFALIEANTDGCERIPLEAARCFTHLATYGDQFLDRLSVHAFGPVTVGDRSYPQQGLFVFHDSTASRKILLSRLDAIEDPASHYYLSIID